MPSSRETARMNDQRDDIPCWLRAVAGRNTQGRGEEEDEASEVTGC